MTLEEAILHAEEVADRCEDFVVNHKNLGELGFTKRTEKCAEEHRQLASWLRELAERRKAPKIVHCGECKWWTKQKNSAQGRCRLLGIYPTGGWYCANGATETE